MISKIFDTSKKNIYQDCSDINCFEQFGKAIYSQLSEEMTSAMYSQDGKSRLINNDEILIPNCVSDCLRKLKGYGVLLEEFSRTQTAIATSQSGDKRVGGLDVSLILGFTTEEWQKSFARTLYRLACFCEDRFFPIACSFDWYYIFAISLNEQNYGAVYGVETYGCDPIFNENPPKPEYLYPNIDAFLADLGPEKSYEETALPEGVTPLMS